jgi:hypothetical protein
MVCLAYIRTVEIHGMLAEDGITITSLLLRDTVDTVSSVDLPAARHNIVPRVSY